MWWARIAFLVALFGTVAEARTHHYLSYGLDNLILFSWASNTVDAARVAAVIVGSVLLFLLWVATLEHLVERFQTVREPNARRWSVTLGLLIAVSLFALLRVLDPTLPSVLSWRILLASLGGVLLTGVALMFGSGPKARSPLSKLVEVLGAASLLLVLAAPVAGHLAFRWSRPAGPNVLLIVMDTVRKQNVSIYDHHRRTTPSLERIGAKGTVFENAFAIAPWTIPNHASIFTGLYSLQHGAIENHNFLSPELLTLSEILYNAGYATAGFSNNGAVSGRTGFAQGYRDYADMWREGVRRALLKGQEPPEGDKGAFATHVAVRDWFGRRRDDERPYFIFINYKDAHGPYTPPEEYRREYLGEVTTISERVVMYNYADFLAGAYTMSESDFEAAEALYDGGIRYLDQQINRLLEFLESENHLENTLLIITSDHGEHFGEHYMVGHQFSLYDALLRIPLIIRFPGSREGSKRSLRNVELVDLFSTVLDAAGVPLPASIDVQGQSLLQPHERQVIFAELYRPVWQLEILAKKYPDFDASPWDRRLRAVRMEGHKLIWSSTGDHELYDMSADPDELRNLVLEKPELAKRMETVVTQLFQAWRTERIDIVFEPDMFVDEELLEELRTLGYIR